MEAKRAESTTYEARICELQKEVSKNTELTHRICQLLESRNPTLSEDKVSNKVDPMPETIATMIEWLCSDLQANNDVLDHIVSNLDYNLGELKIW